MKNIKIISLIILILVLAGGTFLYFRNRKGDTNNSKNNLVASDSQAVEAVVFARNITFEVPNNSSINIDSSPNSVIVVSKTVNQYDPSSYKDLLSKKAIIIQSFPPLNKNKQIFQNYINQRYKATDKITPSIEFTTVNNNEAAIIKIKHTDDNPDEYVEVINLDSPVIIASSEKSESFSTIVSTIKNITTSSEDVTQIRKELQLAGTLLRTGLAADLYSQFSTKAKKGLTEQSLQTTLDGSKTTLKGTISVTGGLWLKSKNQFVCKPSFKDPSSNKKEIKKGQLVLEKENGKWLISQLDIPKD